MKIGRKRKADVDEGAVRADATAGMTTNAIAKKHGTSWATVKAVLDAAGGGKPGRSPKSASAANGRADGNGRLSIVVSAELLDAIWCGLPLAKKCALIEKLEEV